MLEVEGIGSEIITAFFVGALSAALLAIFVSAWRLTGRRPLFYDLFLVEIHSLDARRFVQLGQEFRPLGSWSDVMARIRSRARSQVQANDAASGSSAAVFDTNVVIQSPATVMDDSAATTPPPSSSTLWEIEMPVATPSGEGNDVSHESHFAAAAAIAVLGRGGFQVASSETVDIVPGGPGVSVSSVSAVGDESNSNSVTRIVARRHQRYTGIVMPMNISVVTDEPGSRQDTPSVSGQSEPSPSTSEDVTQSEEPAPSTGSNDDVENRDSTGGENAESANAEIEGDSVIRLKFLDDTQRDARTTMTDTIGKFKSVHFGEAVAAGRVVRLIYQGQLLREDSRTLASYGLRDGCVVHCHISNTPYSRQAPSQPAASSTGLRNRESAANNVAAPAPNAGADLLDFRYPRWAVALLLNTYRFPIIGLPLDAIIRFIFDRQSQEPSTEPGIIRRTYQRLEMSSVRSTVASRSADQAEASNVMITDDNSGVEEQIESLAARIERSGRLHEAEEFQQALTKRQEQSSRISPYERWTTSAPEVNLQRTVQSILSAVFRIDDRTPFSSSSNVHHVDWRCPGKLMCQGMEVECAANVSLQEVLPNAPFGALKFSSPYELARLLSILSQSHIPESWRTARLLDRNHDICTPSGLGLALSFYRQHCVHLTLASVANAGTTQPEHPPRGLCDPYNMGAVADLARRYAELHPWTSISWKQLKPRKNLIVLPAGFQAVLDCLKTDDQTAVVMLKPEDVQPDWFTDDYSSIVLFSTAEFAGTTRWAGTWTLILQQVAKGTELIVLPGPENDQDWRKSVDMLRDLCEETTAQRPSLKSCIKCLLPMKSEFEVIGAAFRTAKFEHGKVFTQSAAKRFWTATTTQHAGILKLAPFKRLAEQATSSAPRNPRPQQGQQSAWRCQQRRGGQAYKHQRTPRIDRPLQMIGNRMFRLVPLSDSRSHTRGGSYRGRNHGTHKKF